MVLRECPVCHQKTGFANSAVYCPHCGWNRTAAISSVKMSMNAIPVAIFMFGALGAFAYWGMKFSRAPELMMFILFPAAFIPLNYFWLKRKLVKLKSMQFPEGVPHTPSNFTYAANVEGSSGAAPAYSPSAQYAALAALPAPRQIRLAKSSTWFRWVVAFSLAPIVAVIAINLYQDWARTSSLAGMGRRDLIMAAAAGGVFMLAAGIWRSQMRECDLLEHGEVVMGCVVRQWSDQKQGSSVEYEFTDFLGQTHRAVGFDRTMRLYSGMPVPVFYDRDNPKRQIAYCAALHEVILPAAVEPRSEELITKP